MLHRAIRKRTDRCQAADATTLVQRRIKTDPVDQGGWSIFHTSWAGLDMINPADHVFLRGNGKSAAPGWPDSPRIEALRNDWFAAPDVPTQQAIARHPAPGFHRRALHSPRPVFRPDRLSR